MNHAKKLKGLQTMRRVCAGAVIFGFVTSAGGNVLNAERNPVSIALALLAPTLFGIMFEIVSRVVFRKEASLVMKCIALVGAGGISAIMAWISYWHQKEAFSQYGDATQATLLPLAIDGLMIIGSVYLIELGFQIRDLEAFIASGAKAQAKAKEEIPVPVTRDKGPTGRERVAAAWANAPNLTVKELSKLTGTSESYTANILSQLRKLTEDRTDLEVANA